MSTCRAIGLAFSMVALLLLAAVRPAAADGYPIVIRFNHNIFGEKVFTSDLPARDGHFEKFITSGNARVHLSGTIAGDNVSLYGELIIPGIRPFKPFSVDGHFASGM